MKQLHEAIQLVLEGNKKDVFSGESDELKLLRSHIKKVRGGGETDHHGSIERVQGWQNEHAGHNIYRFEPKHPEGKNSDCEDKDVGRRLIRHFAVNRRSGAIKEIQHHLKYA